MFAGERVWEGVRCCVEVRVGGCECARGVGEWRGEEGTEMREKLRTRAMARKIAFSRACETAFSNILIVLLPGKPAAAVVRISDDVIITSWIITGGRES